MFKSEVQKKANHYKSNTNFYKSAIFFLAKEWDSTLVYAMKCLNVSSNDSVISNYAHYFRGYSFKQKGLFGESQKEFNLISSNFEFDFIVKKRLGEIALEKNEFKAAIAYLSPLSKLDEKQYAFFSQSSVFQNLGICYLHLNEFAKAEPYLLECIRLRQLQKDTLDLIGAYGNIATLYYEQYKDNLAIPYFEKAYQLSKKTKDFESKQNTSFNMAVVEENRKNFQRALAYRKEYETWKDSLTDQNKIYEVAQIEKQFAVKEKQKEVNLLAAENRAKVQERNGLLYSAITLLILLGVTFYFYKEKIKTNKIVVAQKERLDELNVAKDQLFSIVSHDLRASVNALKTSNTKLLDNLESKNLDALENTLQNNSAIVNGAYNLLDNLLHWALLQTKQSYFHIEPLRLFFIVEQVAYNYKPLMHDKSISFQNLVLQTDKVLADQESLKIILRNLLDNAIKFSNSKDSIAIYTENTSANYCNLIVEDTGVGMDENTLKALLEDAAPLAKKAHEDTIGTGLGLQLCKSYSKRNKGKFYIESQLGKGTKMIVSLPKTQ
ncbi:histidine kinase [Jejuia pallidilutea]|uniref:histidine kinase n=1 Tax=Jejuia pallidilutea TaxID=504487 RepID=A0A090VZY8_9FLAO|nr:histidine kinase [Jejuia pallidilutea]